MLDASNLVLDNGRVRYEFDCHGHLLKGMFRKSGFEFTYSGIGNILKLYADEPHVYDAWDIDIYYTQKMETMSICINRRVYTSDHLRVIADARAQGRPALKVPRTL